MAFIIPGVSRPVELILLISVSSTVIAVLLVVLFRIIRRHGDYAYTNAKISAMRKSVFRKEKINPLLKSKNLQNLLNVMKDSPLSEYLKQIKEPTPRKVELALDRQLYDTYRKLPKMTPQEMKDIFKEIREMIEIRDIKTIISGKISGVPPEEIEEKLFSEKIGEREEFEQAIESESVEEAMSVFKETEYWQPINEGLSEMEKDNRVLPLWYKIERKYWEGVWSKVRTSSAKYSDVVRKAVGMEIDIRNILTVLRCKRDKVPDNEIEEYIIPIYLELEEQQMEKAIKSEDVEKAASAFESSEYGEEISDALIQYRETESLSVIESTLRKLLLNKIRSLSIKYYSGIGPLIGYLYEKRMETKNLKSIVNGVYEGLEPEEIKEKLVAPEV